LWRKCYLRCVVLNVVHVVAEGFFVVDGCNVVPRVDRMKVAFVVFVVVLFGIEMMLFGLLDQLILFQITDVNVVVLVIFVIMLMGIYGIVLVGWSSNNKYLLFGGLRLLV